MQPIDIDQHLRVLDPSTLPVLPGSRPATAAAAKAHRRHARRVERRRFVRLEKHQAAVRHLDPLPVHGEVLHGVIDGTYSGWNLATAAMDLLAEPVAELIVATLGFNRDNCRDLLEALDDGRVLSALLLVSDYFRSSDRTVFADIKRELEARGQRVVVARSHAKLILLHTSTRHVVVETSANLRSSSNWEQFTVSDDAEVFHFHQTWIHDLINTEQK